MSAGNLTWKERITNAKAAGLLAMELYVVLTEPAGELHRVREVLKEHLEYQGKLEQDGVLFAAGPLSDETGQEWTGKGLIILRAASVEAARRIADGDPMHSSGVRSYRLLPWMLNEGSFTLELKLSKKAVDFA